MQINGIAAPVGNWRIEQQLEKLEEFKRKLLRKFKAAPETGGDGAKPARANQSPPEDDMSSRDPKLVLKLGGIIELMIMALRQQLDNGKTLCGMADDPEPPLCATITKSGLTYQSRRSSTAAISVVGRCA